MCFRAGLPDFLRSCLGQVCSQEEREEKAGTVHRAVSGWSGSLRVWGGTREERGEEEREGKGEEWGH